MMERTTITNKTMKKIISMTDFVLEQNKEVKSQTEQSRAFYHCYNYANFLKQPLELWMFVPCDEDMNVLEEPVQNNTKYDIWISNDEVDCDYRLYDDDCLGYQQAKERCLFVWVEGFDYEGICEMFTDLENIIDFDFKLTQTAIKQIGL